MEIKLNDKVYNLECGTSLDEFMASLDVQIQGIAIAIEYEVIPKYQWRDKILEEGMALMMIHAVSGG